MTVIDLRGPVGGGADGLAALAATLHAAASAAERAATSAHASGSDRDGLVTDARTAARALRTAAGSLVTAAEQLRALRDEGTHADAHLVEVTLAAQLRTPLETLTGALAER